MKRVFSEEDAVLEKFGVPFSFIDERAAIEAQAAAEAEFSPYTILGKEYLLSAEERAQLPGFEHVSADEASDMARRLTTPQNGRKMYGEIDSTGF
jgi:hypothetical protein